MSVWEDIRIMCDANRTMVDLEQHTQPAGRGVMVSVCNTSRSSSLDHLK